MTTIGMILQDSAFFCLPEDFDLQQPLLLEASWEVKGADDKQVTLWSKGPFLLAGPLLSKPTQEELESIDIASVEQLCEFLGTRRASQVCSCQFFTK